jgi:putative MATE family efflux protein
MPWPYFKTSYLFFMTTKTLSSNKFFSSLSIIGRALLGEQQDFTQGSLRRAVVLLAIPMIIEMGMESVFAVVDLFFVSKLGAHAISTIGLTESVLTIIYSLAIGGSMAATALVARRVGEKNPEAAAETAMQTIWVGLTVILLVSAVGFWAAPQILGAMGAEPETIRIGTPYTRIMMGTSTFIMMLFLINGVFRGAGDASVAMKSLMIANGCNIILCPVLIRGLGPIPALGLSGAALATSIGRGVGVCYQLAHLFGGKGVVKLTAASLKARWKMIRTILSIAWPATLQFIIASCSWVFLARLVAETGGHNASAGYQVALRLVVFFILPAWGISNAAATLVGQNLGAQNAGRAEAAVWKTVKYNVGFMVFVSLLFLFATRPLVGIFTKDVIILEVAVTALRIVSTGYIFYGIGMVLTNAFNGAGDTKTPTLINFFGFWLFQIPLAWLLAKGLDLGPKGVFIAIPVAETSITIASFIIFRKAKWKTVKV